MPIENNDPLILVYLAEREFSSYPQANKTDAQKESSNYNISLNQSLLKYIQSKNIFQQIELCEKQKQDYRLKLLLQKYNWHYYHPIHPLPSIIFLAGLPLFLGHVEYNISIKIEIYRNTEIISEYLHIEDKKFNVFERKIPEDTYKYVEIPLVTAGGVSEIYMDGIYDKLFDKIYLDAKSWK
ncbi:MAG: hypothetical protein KBA66_22950 [Leptospiraceae bacterium]|nr:hypothetical protein [Leptospiraceae bacterium]